MSAAMSIESVESAEKRAKRVWIALVVFLCIIQSTIMGTVMHLAIGDPAGAVVPDYHNRALNWDATRRTHETAGRLGWEVTFEASDVADDRGMRAIELKIVDSEGAAIDDLVINGNLYHHAHADHVSPVSLKSVGEGKYLTLAPAARPGIWQLEVEIGGASEPAAESLTFNIKG